VVKGGKLWIAINQSIDEIYSINMETITITVPASDIIPLIDILIYNIYYCREVDYDEHGVIELYQHELDKLKPIFLQRDPYNYSIYSSCDWDYEKYREYVDSIDGLDLDMEG
jgi:hypothetical protein